MLTVTRTSRTWLASYTKMPPEPSVATSRPRTSLLPPQIPMLERTEGRERKASPATVTLREASMESTKAEVGGSLGCCKVAHVAPTNVTLMNPSTRTYSVQVPLTVTVAGKNLTSVARVRVSD